jgi:hypothetical protein
MALRAPLSCHRAFVRVRFVAHAAEAMQRSEELNEIGSAVTPMARGKCRHSRFEFQLD